MVLVRVGEEHGLGSRLEVETAWDTGAFALRGVEGLSGVQQQALPLARCELNAVAADFVRGAVDGDYELRQNWPSVRPFGLCWPGRQVLFAALNSRGKWALKYAVA